MCSSRDTLRDKDVAIMETIDTKLDTSHINVIVKKCFSIMIQNEKFNHQVLKLSPK